MKWNFDHEADGRNKSHDDLNLSSFQLGDSRSPDLTRRIMGRLGYMRVSDRVARRHRIRRWLGRTGTLLTAALAVGIGMRVYESSDLVRRPEEITIPAAIGNDIREQHDRIGNVIRTIRTLAPLQPRVEPVNSIESDLQDSSIHNGDFVQPAPLPFRWV